MLAGEVDDVQAEPLRELFLEGERFGEMEPGLEEQDGNVGLDPRRHMDDCGAFGLECRGDGHSGQPFFGKRPLQDLGWMLILETSVQLSDLVFGKQQVHGDPRVRESAWGN